MSSFDRKFNNSLHVKRPTLWCYFTFSIKFHSDTCYITSYTQLPQKLFIPHPRKKEKRKKEGEREKERAKEREKEREKIIFEQCQT